MSKYRVVGSRGAQYECDTLAEAKKVAGKNGTIRRVGGQRKRRNPSPKTSALDGHFIMLRGGDVASIAFLEGGKVEIQQRSKGYAREVTDRPSDEVLDDLYPSHRAMVMRHCGMLHRNPSTLSAEEFHSAWQRRDWQMLIDEMAQSKANRAALNALLREAEAGDNDAAEVLGTKARLWLEGMREDEAERGMLHRHAPLRNPNYPKDKAFSVETHAERYTVGAEFADGARPVYRYYGTPHLAGHVVKIKDRYAVHMIDASGGGEYYVDADGHRCPRGRAATYADPQDAVFTTFSPRFN